MEEARKIVKRSVKFDWKGVPFNVEVTSPAEEISLRLAFVVKLLSSGKNLEPIPGELALFPVSEGPKVVSDTVVSSYTLAREKMKGFLAGIEQPNIRLVWDQMDKKRQTLLHLDPTFVLELGLFKVLSEGAAARILEARVLNDGSLLQTLPRQPKIAWQSWTAF